MARRSPPRNELQDPTQPQRQRARWRVIGAAVLGLVAIVMLPLALESEPKQSLSDVAIRIPERASLDQGRSWLERRDTDVVPGDRSAPVERAPAPVAQVEIAPPRTQTLPVPPPRPAEEAAPASEATSGSPGDAGAEASRSDAAMAAARQESGDAARSGGNAAGQPAKPASANDAAAARASERSKQAVEEKPPPPMPERRRDRNAVKAASPSGYVVQIGAFSNMKGARTQIERARKLGFEAYTETITTKKGDRIRVRVGPYLTREQANVARARLRTEGIDTVLIAP